MCVSSTESPPSGSTRWRRVSTRATLLRAMTPQEARAANAQILYCDKRAVEVRRVLAD